MWQSWSSTGHVIGAERTRQRAFSHSGICAETVESYLFFGVNYLKVVSEYEILDMRKTLVLRSRQPVVSLLQGRGPKGNIRHMDIQQAQKARDKVIMAIQIRRADL
jgi:hypothetical protein